MFAIIVLPMTFLVLTLRRRRWSLSWLLLAPAVLAIALVAWKSPWLADPDLLTTMTMGITRWACIGTLWMAYRQARRSSGSDVPRASLNVGVYLGVGLPVLIVTLLLNSYIGAKQENVTYTVAPTDLLLLAFLSLDLICIIYWCLRTPVDVGRWIAHGFRWIFSRMATR